MHCAPAKTELVMICLGWYAGHGILYHLVSAADPQKCSTKVQVRLRSAAELMNHSLISSTQRVSSAACRLNMDAALGGQLEFQFFHAWFNGLFLAAALISLILVWWQWRTSAADTSLDAVPLLPMHTAFSKR